MSDRLDSLAIRFLDLKKQVTKDEAALRTKKDDRDAAEQELWRALDRAFGRIKYVVLELDEPHGTVGLRRNRTVTASVLNETMAIEDLRRRGLDHMVGPGKLRKKVVNQHVRDLAEAGRTGEVPDGLDVHDKKAVQVTNLGRAETEQEDEDE